MSETILLVHGLAGNSAAMGFLATSLRLQGYKTVSIDYPSTKHTIEECTRLYLKSAIEALTQEESFSIVLPVSHDSILVDPLAIFQTSYFLKHGAFRSLIAEPQKQAA